MTEIETHRFSNGLKLIFEKLPGCKSVGIAIGFPAGGQTEDPRVSGISHYLEHMIFKGTKNIRYFHTAFEKVGARTNAMTDVDTTVYVSECPKQNAFKTLGLWLQLLTEASLDREEFERERGVILSEYYITEDNPDSLVEKNATLHLFKGHSLSTTVIGTEDTIKAISHDDLHEYYNFWYHPSNSVIWISGDLNMDRLVEIVKEKEEWIKKNTVSTPSHKTFIPKGPSVIELNRQIRLTQVALAFSSPTQSAVERASFQVFTSMLSSGRSSIIQRLLVLENELTDHLRVIAPAFNEAGMLFTSFAVQPTKLHRVLALLTKTIRNLRNAEDIKEEFETSRSHAIGSMSTSIDAQLSWRALQGAVETLRRGHCSWDETIGILESLKLERFIENTKEIIKPERISLVLAGAIKKQETKNLQL